MHTTSDRYREAGMPPPRGTDVTLPASKAARRRGTRRLADAARAQGVPVEHAPGGTLTKPPLAERVNGPATDGPVLPEIEPAAYGPDSAPLDTTDADTEEQS